MPHSRGDCQRVEEVLRWDQSRCGLERWEVAASVGDAVAIYPTSGGKVKGRRGGAEKLSTSPPSKCCIDAYSASHRQNPQLHLLTTQQRPRCPLSARSGGASTPQATTNLYPQQHSHDHNAWGAAMAITCAAGDTLPVASPNSTTGVGARC